MKKYIILTFVLAFIINSYGIFAENYPFSAGIFATGKGSINTQDPINGVKNAMAINDKPDLGLTIYIPFAESTKVGACIDVAWSNLAYNMYDYFNKDNNVDVRYQYFTIAPSIHVWGFTLGFGYNIPLDVTAEGNWSKFAYSTESLQSTFDIRFGGMIPLYSNDFGRVNLIINATYNMSGTFDESKLPIDISKAINPQPGAISIGANYLFHVGNLFK